MIDLEKDAKEKDLTEEFYEVESKIKPDKSISKEILEWIYCVIIAVALALLFRYYIGTPTLVQQQSMQETLMPSDRLFLNKWIKTTNGEYKKGDIVTFESPSNTYINYSEYDKNNPVAQYNKKFTGINSFIYYVLEFGKESYIKRVIGIEGDSIKIQKGEVYVNEEKISEPYLNGKSTPTLDGLFIDLVVPEGYVYVLGDNRPESTDSRRFGCIPVERIESKVSIRIWPLNKFGKIEE